MKTVQETTFGTVFQPWPLKPLPDVAFFQEGPGLRKWQWTDSGMKVVNVTNILGDGTVDVNNTARFISSEEYETKYRHFTVDDGDIVVASSGNTYGKVGRINKSHLPLMMNTSVIRFHPAEPEQLDQDFLFAFLRSDLFKNQMESFVIGSAQPNFGPSHLKRMVIPCPPLPTQRKIASILSAYDDLIENNTRRIAILEEMAQAIYREWFVNFRFPGHENVKLVDSPLGQIPEGWEVRDLYSAADVQYGFAFKSKLFNEESEGLPVIRIRNVPNHNSNTFTTQEVDEKYVVANGDILIGMDGDFHMCRWSGGTALLNQRVTRIRGTTALPEYALFHALKTPIEHLNSTIVGTTVAHLGKSHLEKLHIAVPNEALCEHGHAVFDPLYDLEINLRRKNAVLRQNRDLLLPKLISGKLDVEDLDIDLGMTAEALAEATA